MMMGYKQHLPKHSNARLAYIVMAMVVTCIVAYAWLDAAHTLEVNHLEEKLERCAAESRMIPGDDPWDTIADRPFTR